ncbi:MAG: hypothetical protein LBT50_07135 [Prevotellaceae bacterium]|jgi:hypothetical protein|nr:hypothetical protein [Prevotellaceae bacterium]
MKLYLEFSDDLKSYLQEHNHDIVSILRNSGYSVVTKNIPVESGTVIDLEMVIASAMVSGVVLSVVTDIFKALWRKFNTLFGSSKKIIFVDEEKENVIINEYGEVNIDAINDTTNRIVKIKIQRFKDSKIQRFKDSKI